MYLGQLGFVVHIMFGFIPVRSFSPFIGHNKQSHLYLLLNIRVETLSNIYKINTIVLIYYVIYIRQDA